MEIVKVNINELISPEYNPRQITDDEMGKLKNSINEFGYIDPIIVNRVNNHIVGGNQRYECLKALGYNEIDVIFIEEPDINREKALNIALNKISGEWDYDKLQEVLQELELSSLNVELTGFDNEEIKELDTGYLEDETPVIEDNYNEEDTEDTDIKHGDLFRLGNHYLCCGDATIEEDIERLLTASGDRESIDLLLTDPPYGINIVNSTNTISGDKPCTIGEVGVTSPVGFNKGTVGAPGIVKARKYYPIINDDKPFNPEPLLKLKVDSIIWGANNFSSKLPDSPRWIVWYKKPFDKKNNGNFSDVELAWTNMPGKTCKLYHYLWSGLLREGERKLELKERVHPTQKPVGLLINILNDFVESNTNILDLFGGSGSTLIACEQTNRNCYMMELAPHYCQVIIDRWEQFTGKKALKLN